MTQNVFLCIFGILAIVAVFIIATGANSALQRRKRRQNKPYDSGVVLGWARVSLLGREEHIGMVTICNNGKAYEVATVGGKAFRTSTGAVYKVERVPFEAIEREAVELEGAREAEAKRKQEWAEERHAEELLMQKRIENLRAAIRCALNESTTPETIDPWRKSLAGAIAADDTETNESHERRYPF